MRAEYHKKLISVSVYIFGYETTSLVFSIVFSMLHFNKRLPESENFICI